MRNIRCLTYPKSGQHLLVNILLKYFSKNINYNDSVKRNDGGSVMQAGKLFVCEAGIHCYRAPCTEPATNFQVMHDCNQLWEDYPNINYLFLFRNPIYCLLSLTDYGKNLSYCKEWDIDDYNNFFGERILEWREWIYKWIVNNKHPNVFIITYENLISSPETEMREIIQYIEPNEEVNIELLKSVIEFMNIEQKHKISDFKYYSKLKNILRIWEMFIMQELELLNLPKIKWE